MRRCIIHIGMPKAGSTTLQGFLTVHAERLRAAGVLVPALGKGPQLGHRALAQSLSSGGKAFERDLLPALEKSLRRSGCEDLLLSYEGLQGLPRRWEAPQRLTAGFARLGLHVTFIAVVRPQHGFLNSFYCHNVYWLRTSRRFGHYASKIMADELFDYSRRLQQWTDCSGADFRALPLFPQPGTGGGSLEARFLAIAGLPAPEEGVAPAALRNQRPGPLTVELLRQLTAAGGGYRLDHRLGPCRSWLMRRCTELGWQEERFAGLTPELVDGIRSRFALSNQRFAERHLGGDWDRIFARDYEAPPLPNEYDPAFADPRLAPQIDALAAGALARFGRPWTTALQLCLEQQLRQRRRTLRRLTRRLSPGRSLRPTGPATGPAGLTGPP